MDVIDYITDNTLILTPNQRLSADLTQQYDQHLTLHGKPQVGHQIIPIKNWLQELWQLYQAFDSRLLLASQHELYIWQNAIQGSQSGEDLVDIKSTAKSAKQAWDLCHEWDIDYKDNSFNDNDNANSFQLWANHFQHYCQERHLISSSEATNILISNIHKIANTQPNTIYLYHFLELTPQQQKLVASLKEHGMTISLLEANTDNLSSVFTTCNDKDHEYHCMSEFAKTTHEQNKSARIGCIVPELHAERDTIERYFKAAFSTEDLPVDFSAGKPLSNYPIIQIVITLLKLLTWKYKTELMSQLIISPFIADAESQINARYLVDAAFKKYSNHTMDLKQSISLVLEHQKIAPLVDAKLNEILRLISDTAFNTERTPREIANTILTLLTAIGWPGERQLNSEEHQLVNKFIGTLNDFSQFFLVTGKLKTNTAINIFIQQLQATIFQIEKEKMKIQVLGTLEASGIQFDYVWVCGYNDTNMPSPPKANPFIPHHVQAAYNIPHSTAEREYEFCKALTQQLIDNNKHVIFSYALFDNSNPQRMSQLISDLPEKALPYQPQLQPAINHADAIETVTDNTASAFTQTKLPGGTDTIRRQSICPFQAFATYRLKASGLESNQLGISALDKGNLTHSALEYIWTQLKTQKKLLLLNPQERNELIATSIKASLKQHAIYRYFSTPLIKLEQQRLAHLLDYWLTQECSRDPFSVEQIEHQAQYTYHSITVAMKLDRMDSDSEGNLMIIDYKTGATNIKDWFSSQMKQPQLPMYLVSSPDSVSAIAFAEVKQDIGTYRGIIDHATQDKQFKEITSITYPDSCNSWHEQIKLWQTQVNHLIEEFISGQAIPRPLDRTVCLRCDLHSLCRITEHE